MTRLVIKKAEPLEKDIQNAVCEYLERRGHFFYRQNNTPIFQKTGASSGFFRAMPKWSLKGIPDIIVIGKECGTFIGLEIKRPSGKQSPEQKLFQQRCIQNGAEYYIIRKVDDLIEIGL